ncbi:phosphatidic acid phosphatase type 2/haloperoxidase [Melampsora americana]|nr:phosphatidic acid phosphatase type 2/haloperoxidase [Melampsora americana]
MSRHQSHRSNSNPLRPQDKFGIFPDALFRSRQQNLSRQTAQERRLRLLRSYLPDWIFIIALCVGLYFLEGVSGFHRQFDLNDTSIRHPHAETERVPVLYLGIYSILIPVVLIVVCSQGLLRSFWDTHNGLLGLAFSLSFNWAITTAMKNTIGRPRPDFIDRCQPASDAVNSAIGLSDDSICTTALDSRLLMDGFRSFPSGHASTAWCGLGYLSLYLAGKFHLFDQKGHTLKAWLVLSPLLGAALISISRTMDYRHHWQDVFVGGLLGMLVAWFGYRMYYPSLSTEDAHKPYSPRLNIKDRSSPILPVVNQPYRSHGDRISADSNEIMLQTSDSTQTHQTPENQPALKHLS